MFGVFLFLTYYMQQTLGFSPLVSGLAFLPMMAMIMPAGAIGQTRLLPRFGPRPLVAAGMLLSAVAMLMFTGVTVDSSYATEVLPGPARDRPRPGPDLRPGDGHRDARRRRRRRRRGLGAGQHRPAGRRLDRHRAAEHAGGRRRRRATRRPTRQPPTSPRRPPSTATPRPSPGPPRCSRSARLMAWLLLPSGAPESPGRRRRAGVRALSRAERAGPPARCPPLRDHRSVRSSTWRRRSNAPEATSSARSAARRSSTPPRRCSRRCPSPTSRSTSSAGAWAWPSPTSCATSTRARPCCSSCWPARSREWLAHLAAELPSAVRRRAGLQAPRRAAGRARSRGRSPRARCCATS